MILKFLCIHFTIKLIIVIGTFLVRHVLVDFEWYRLNVNDQNLPGLIKFKQDSLVLIMNSLKNTNEGVTEKWKLFMFYLDLTFPHRCTFQLTSYIYHQCKMILSIYWHIYSQIFQMSLRLSVLRDIRWCDHRKTEIYLCIHTYENNISYYNIT